METKKNTNSVPEEQFGDDQKKSETTGDHADDTHALNSIPEDDTADGSPDPEKKEDTSSPKRLRKTKKKKTEDAEPEADAEQVTEDNADSVKPQPADEVISGVKEEITEVPARDETPEPDANAQDTKGEDEMKDSAGSDKSFSDETESESRNDPAGGEEAVSPEVEKTETLTDKDHPEEDSDKIRETYNYSLLSRIDLIRLLEDLLSNKPYNEIRNDVEAIKVNFYKKFNAELEQKRRSFISEGGNEEDFKPFEEPDEIKFRNLLKKYRELRIENNRNAEDEKQENLKKKYKVIEGIKDLINSQESINKTFQDFRELQNQWRSIGMVPQAGLNDLWKTYHHHVEKFYDYIKINKELKDLDLKKNLEEKIAICEKTEALLLDPNIINAFKILQTHHEEWREVGPVPEEKRTEIWERFKEATTKINRKHQKHFQDLKEQHKKNLEQKKLICSRVEEILGENLNSHQEWIKMTNEIIELQRVWKTIGFAPKKDNNIIYARFRSFCDKFFERKKAFYAQNMEVQHENLQQKLDLCVQAEALQESTDWRRTADELIKLQKQWKQTGPVPRKQSDQVWKRFRVACDKFFRRKSDHMKNIDNSYIRNLELKEALIREIQEFKASDDMEKNLEILQEFQRRWTEIGFVPIAKKDEIQQKFRALISKLFDSLEVDDLRKNVIKYESRLEIIRQKPHSDEKLNFERDKFISRLQQMKNDISVWENNIGFFANTESAEEMKREFEKKIKDTKEKIKLLEEKINLIDNIDPD